jgi:PAS domain S-box-containing protein
MNKLKPLSVGKRVLFTFGTLCAILLIVGGLFFFSLRSIERGNQQQQSRALNKLALIDDTAQDVGQMQAEALRQVLASDMGEIKRLDQTVRDIEKINARELADYQKLVDTEKEKKLYDRVMQARKAYWEQTQPVLALGLSKRDAEATELIISKQAPAYDEYLKAINELINYVETDAKETARATTRFIFKIRTIGDVLAGVAILIAIGTGFAVAGVARRLKEDNNILQAEIKERKQAEEKLSWKTAFLEAQVNSTIDGILVVDEQGKTILQNQRTADLLKMPQHIADDKDDETQRRWVAGRTKNPEQFVEKVAYLYSHPNESGRDETEFKDGTILDRYSAPVVGKDGKYYGRIWTFRDITERKRAEEQLRVQATALDAAANAIVITDHTGTIQSVNPAFTALTGYTAQEAVGQNPRILKGGNHDEAFYRNLWQTISSGQVWRGEMTNRRKDGSLYPEEMTITPLRNADGTIARYIAIKQDITARKELEAQMERLRTEHALILNSIGEGVHWIDVDGRIKFENPAAAKMLGYEVSELIGKPAHSTMHHTRADGAAYLQSECPIYATLKDGAVRRVTDEVFWRKDGSSFAVEYICTPIYDKNGRSGGSVVIFTDSTARKRLEAQLFQSQKLETVGKLAGGVAHEFNSILTAIIGQSELILADLPSGHPLFQNAAGIRRAAERAATLTRQLLAYGRRAFLRPESLDLNQVMAGTEGMVRQLMGGDVDMRIVPAEDLRAVKADAGQIEQVIMNLAMNARDAMPNGGKFTLETANVSFDQERVGRDPELKPGDYVMLAITDTGTGMSAEVKARAFEPFFTTKGVGQGTGLGLSTCYGIIKQSGGHISVYSEPGRGTTFKIYLPQVELQTKIPLQRLDSPDLPRGTETILLVEDDPALREMAATLLRRLGYTVLAAANGIEALSLKPQRDSGPIDMLFTDVVMPHMSGKELSERVRALYPHTRTLFTSGYTENAIVHQGVLNPGVTLLQKPFTPSALAHKLREVLDQPGAPKPDPAQKTSGFTKISDEAKTPVN